MLIDDTLEQRRGNRIALIISLAILALLIVAIFLL